MLEGEELVESLRESKSVPTPRVKNKERTMWTSLIRNVGQLYNPTTEEKERRTGQPHKNGRPEPSS